MQQQQSPRNNFARQCRTWMNLATIALSSIASAAVNGIARLISPTRTGILVRPSRASANSRLSTAPGCSSPLLGRGFSGTDWALAIAQQSLREFLTEALAFVSVKGCGVLPHSVCAPCAIYPG